MGIPGWLIRLLAAGFVAALFAWAGQVEGRGQMNVQRIARLEAQQIAQDQQLDRIERMQQLLLTEIREMDSK